MHAGAFERSGCVDCLTPPTLSDAQAFGVAKPDRCRDHDTAVTVSCGVSGAGRALFWTLFASLIRLHSVAAPYTRSGRTDSQFSATRAVRGLLPGAFLSNDATSISPARVRALAMS